MRPFVALAVLLLASPAAPQTVADALRGTAKPLLVADLPESYRAVSLSSGDGPGSVASLFMMGMGSGQSENDPKSRLFFSLMGSSFVDPEEFAALLDGKRPRIRAFTVDLGATIAKSGSSAKVPTPVFAETWIEAGRIVQWSPKPALTKAALIEAFGKADVPGGSPGEQSAGLSNVKQISVGMMMYSQDYDDRFPAAQSSSQAQKVAGPYVKNDAVWKSPNGGRVLYNTALSNVSMVSIEDVAGTILVWEEKPYPDGKRAVGYTDGHAGWADEEGWAGIWAAEMRRRERARMAAPQGAATSGTTKVKIKVKAKPGAKSSSKG